MNKNQQGNLMKKQFIALAIFIYALVFAGCNKKPQIVTRQNLIIEHEKLHDFGDDDPGFGILYYMDLEDSITRVTFYDGYDYDYVELGDTLAIQVTKKTFRQKYNKCNMVYQEDANFDPGDELRKKNEIRKNDTLFRARRELLRKYMDENPIQIMSPMKIKVRK
jgi:hypothetical protein